MVLNQRINHGAVGGEVGNHVRLSDDELPVQDVVVGIIAAIDDEREVHHKTSGIAVAVGAGIGLVGRHAVVSQELGIALPIDDNTSAGAFHLRGDVKPAADEIQIMILIGVGIYRNRVRQNRPIGVLRVFLASMQ